MLAREFAVKGNLPIFTFVARFLRLGFGQADAADLGMAIGRVRNAQLD